MSLTVNASINQKQQPNEIFVHGSVLVYSSDHQISVQKAEPQGFNPAILLLRLDVTEHERPMNGVMESFSYREEGDHVNAYSHVQVVSNRGDDVTVEVDIFG